MAAQILNRRALRQQADQAQSSETIAPNPALVEVPPKKPSKAKAPAMPKVRQVRAKKAPPRLRARWGVFDAGMKQVAIFDYNQRAASDEKLADLIARGRALTVNETRPRMEGARGGSEGRGGGYDARRY
jgi:hypothetical protein